LFDTKTGQIENILSNNRKVGINYLSRDVSWHPNEPLLVSTSWGGNLNLYNFNPNPAAKELECT
jgi:hypothetical protein